jgi:hypothetical protein
VGGGFSVVTSVFSSILVNSININSQALLGAGYAVFAIIVFVLLVQTKWKGAENKKQNHSPLIIQSTQVRTF